jgi:hypothetical protein
MTFTESSAPRLARLAGFASASLCLLIVAAGCASGGGTTAVGGVSGGSAASAPGTSAGASGSPAGQRSPRPAGLATSATDRRALAAAYLRIAKPANDRLEVEVDGFNERQRDDLAAARADLRAEAATERRFDRRLLRIGFPARIAATARWLVLVNQNRIALTDLQARAPSLAAVRSLDGRHKAADTAVEVQVRIIRRDLGLPPPDTS